MHLPGLRKLDAADIQSIFLIERYISQEYLGELLKIWRDFVEVNEACFSRYMRSLPIDARRRPLPLQADVTWRGTVLPNIRESLQGLEDGYRQVLSGDLNGLTSARGPVSDHRGIIDFAIEWMTNDEMVLFERLLAQAYLLAFNIDRTEGAYWSPGSLSYEYEEGLRGPLDLPIRLPRYQIANEPGVRSGYRVPVAGIYIADIEHGSPQFLNTRLEAPPAEVLVRHEPVLNPLDGSVCGKNAVTED